MNVPRKIVTQEKTGVSIIPSIGRIVIYVDVDNKHYPSVIVDSDGFDNCTLEIFGLPEKSIKYDVVHNENQAPTTWHWPKRV